MLEGKFVLLDCNILIYSVRYKNEFKPFYEELTGNNVKPAIDQFIKLEFLRSANTQALLKAKADFLNLFLGANENRLTIPLDSEILVDASRFSNLYNYLNLKKQNVSVGDCIIAADLKKYSHSLVLATANNSDFPLKLFDRLLIKTIEAGEQIINVGFYTFSETKFSSVLEGWNKS